MVKEKSCDDLSGSGVRVRASAQKQLFGRTFTALENFVLLHSMNPWRGRDVMDTFSMVMFLQGSSGMQLNNPAVRAPPRMLRKIIELMFGQPSFAWLAFGRMLPSNSSTVMPVPQACPNVASSIFSNSTFSTVPPLPYPVFIRIGCKTSLNFTFRTTTLDTPPLISEPIEIPSPCRQWISSTVILIDGLPKRLPASSCPDFMATWSSPPERCNFVLLHLSMNQDQCSQCCGCIQVQPPLRLR